MATKFVLLLVFVASAFAGPLSNWDSGSTTCATTCPERTKFRYEPGKTYEYTYESDLKTSIPGATEEHSSLHMRSTVQVEVMSQCEMVLKLSDVSLQDSDPSQYESRTHVDRALDFKRALQEKPLRFAFVDGRIENICPEDEETWTLNIKRGVLSSFQNTMYSLENNVQIKEVDVSGDCPTNYEVVEQGWSTRKLKKSKDLLACTDRHGQESAFQSTQYRVPSSIQSLPLMKSTHECEQEVNTDGLLIQSICTEMHTFRPFSKDASGAATEVNYKLIFRKQSNGVESREGVVSTRESLLFNHEQTPEEIAENLREARDTLNQLCEQTTNDIRPETPALFADLVRKMRKLDSRSLSRLHSAAEGICKKAVKFFHDAVPMVGSSASISLIHDLLKSGEVQGNEAEIWLTNMAFISTPSKEMISQLKPLLDLPQPFRKTSLTVSSLVHSYCRTVSDCDEDEDVQGIIKALEDNLRYNCVSEDDAQHDKVLMSLKAIGNAGFARRVVPTLNRCFQNSDISAEMRVAALGAFRRMGCEADRSELMTLLMNQLEDSEIRIGAYLALMTCPTTNTIERIRSLLETEEVNQVGSFIWTHLTNLAETSAPHKQDIREIIENQELAKEFDLDNRKFSRNIEWSLFSEMINTGAMLESNVIFSSESFVPRSAMLNLTVDMFGESMNLLEVGGRLQGMEKLLEDVFGPTGEMNDLREKRSVDEVNNLDSTYGLKRDTPQASYYLKVFGNEIRYDDIQNFDLSTLKDNMNYLEWLIQLAQEHEFEMTKSFMFLDSTIKIPTAVGMPLRLSVDGTTTVNMKVTGKFDIRKMATFPSTVEIAGSVKPSAAVEIRAEMGVDAHVSRTGLRMVNTLHTSTVADGRFAVKESQILNVDFNMPNDKMEILSAESKFFVTHRDTERPQNMITQGRREYKKCTEGQVFGLELCGELEFPYAYKKDTAPWFPLTGPSSAKLYITKMDSWTGINFEAKYVQDKKRNADRQWEITDNARLFFNMPGARQDREMLAEFTLDRANWAAKFNMKTPWKKAECDGSIVNTAELRQINARAVIDERKTYSFLAELAKADKKLRDEYTPNMEIVIPGRETIRLTGSIAYRESKKAEVSLRLSNMFRDPVVFKGDLEKKENSKGIKYGGDVTVKSRVIDAKVSGFYMMNQDAGISYATRLETEYEYMSAPKQKFTFNNKIRDQSTKSLNQYTSDTAWTSTFLPNYDGDVKLGFTNGRTTFNANFDAGFDEERRITFDQTANLVWNRKARTVDGRVAFKFPAKNIDFEASANHELNDDSINTNALVRYAPNRQGEFKMALSRESVKPLKLDADISLHYPGREMRLKETIEEKEPQEFHHSLDLTLAKYQNVRMTSVYKMSPRHEVTAEINLPSMEPITMNAHFNPEPTNFQIHGEMSYQQRTYLADLNSQQSGSATQYTIRMNAEFSCPARQFLGSTDITRNGDVYTLNMENSFDARRDPSKKVTLAAEVTAVHNAPVVSLKFKTWPGHFVNLDLSGEYATQGWYRSSEDLKGAITMTSSIPNMEQVSGSFNYDHGPRNVKTSGEFSWAEGQKITTEMSLVQRQAWKSMDFTMRVGTPFRGYRTMVGESTYAIEGTSFTSSNKVTWERRAIALDINHQPGRNAYNGDIKITTPFEAYEIISTSVAHTWNGQQMVNSMEATMGANTISLKNNMQHTQNGYNVNNNGDVTLTTPFDAIRIGRIAWSHDNSAQVLKSHAELEYNGQKGMVDLDGSHESNNRRRQMQVKATLQTPFPGAEEMAVGFSHEHQLNSWQGIKSEITAGPVSYSHEIDISQANSAIKAKFVSPIENFERIMLKSEMKLNAQNYETSHMIRWGADSKMTLDGSLALPGNYAHTATLRFASPFEYAERLAFNSNFQTSQTTSALHADVEYGANYRYSIDNTGEMRNGVARAELTIETPHEVFRSMKLMQESTGTLRNFVHTKEFTLNGDKSTFKIISNTENLDNIDVNAEITTPYRMVRRAKVGATHQRQGRVYTTAAEIDVPKYSGSARHEMTYNPNSEYSCTYEINYMPGQKISGTSRFAWRPNFEGALMISTPFEGFERHEISFSHEGQYNNFKASAEMINNGRQKTNMDVEYVVRKDLFRSSARFTSPFRQVERIAAAVNHKGPITNFQTDVSLEFNNERINTETEFALEGTTLKTKTTVNTPFRAFRTGSIEVTHNGEAQEFTNALVLNYNGQMINANSQFAVTSGNFHIDTPFSAMRVFDAKYEHTGPFKNFRNSATVSYNGQSVNANSEFNFRRMTGKVHLDTPFEHPSNIDASFEHNGGLTNFNNELVFNYNQQEIKLTGRLTNAPVAGTFQLTTPFEARSMELSFNHEGELAKFQTGASVRYNNKQINANTAFDWEGITGSLHIDTPFSELTNMDTSFTHNGKNWRNFENSGSFELNGMKYTGDSEFRWFGSAFRLRTTVKTPDEYSIKINHKGDRFDFNNKAVIGVNKDSVSVSTVFKWEGDNMNGKVDVETPYKGYQNQEITFTKTGPLNNFASKLEAKLPFKNLKRFTTEYTHAGTMNDFGCNFSWTSSNKYVDDIKASIKHTGDSRNFNTATSFSKSGETVNTNVEFNLQNKAGKFHLDTPTPYVRNVDVAFAHNGDLANFNNEASLNFNNQEMKVTGRLSNSPLSGNFKLETPYTPIRTLETEFSHDGDASNWRNNGFVSYNNQKINANTAFNKNGMTGSAHLDTPFNALNNIDASFEHNGRGWKRMDTQGAVDVNGQKYDARTTFNANRGAGSLQINTPHMVFRSLDVAVNHNGDIRNFANSGSVTFNGQKYEANSKLDTTNGMGSFQINTPHDEMRNLDVAINHNGDLRSFTNSGSVKYNGQKYDASAKFDAEGGYGTLTLNTPHRELRSLEATINHAGEGWKSFDNTGSVNYNGQNYMAKTSFNAEGPSGSFKLETPHEEVRNLDLDFQHNGKNWRNWENNGNANFNGQRYSGESNFRWARNLFRAGASARIPHEYSLKINHKGDASNFNNKASLDLAGKEYSAGSSYSMEGGQIDARVNVDTPHRNFKSQSLVFRHNGNTDNFETTGALETSYSRYPKFDFKVSHKGDRQVDTNVEVNTPISGYERFAAGLNHVQRRQNINTIASVETPFPGYEKFQVNFDHDGHMKDFKTNMKINTPLRNYENFGVAVSHKGEPSNFESSVTLDLPCEQVPRVTLTLKHAGDFNDFTSTASVEYNNKKTEGTFGLKKSDGWGGASYEAMLNLKCSCPYLRDLSIVAAHNRKTEVKTGSLDITHNGIKKLDFDYSYNTDGFRNVRVTVREPRAMETELTIRDPQRMAGDVAVNWNTKEMDSNARFEFGFKNIMEPSNIDQEFMLKTIMPHRTVGITIGHIKTDSRYNRNAEIIWGNDAASRVSYDIDINTSQRRAQNMYDGSFKVNTPVYDFIGTFNHKTIPGVQYTTEVTMESGERLTITNDLLMTKPGYKHTITINHPRLSQPASLTTEGTFTETEVNGKITFEFERDTKTFVGRIADETRGDNKKFIASTHVTHPNSNLNFQWEGALECTSDRSTASMSTSYLTSRRETLRASLRAEKANGEISVEMTTPAESYKLNCNQDIDEYNGVYRYNMVAACSDNEVRAEVMLNKFGKSVEAKAYYTAEDYVHVYAKYMTPSHMQFEAYHTESGNRVSDLLASLALKEGQIISGRAYARPTIYRDLKQLSRSSRYQATVNQFMNKMESGITQEVRMKMNAMARSARPLIDIYEAIAENINQKMQSTNLMYQRLYRNNEYHTRDIVDGMTRASTAMIQKMEEWKTCVADKMAIINGRINRIARRTAVYLQKSLDNFESMMEEMKVRMTILQQKYQPYVDNAAQIVKQKLIALVERVRSNRAMNMYWRKLSNLDYMQPYKQAKTYVIRRTAEINQRYAKQIATIRKVVLWVNEQPQTQLVKKYVMEKVDKSKWLINYLEIESKAREFIGKYREGGWEYVKQQISEAADKYLQFNRNSFSWDAENNDLRFDVFVPIELRDLQTVPTLNIEQYISTASNLVESVMPEESDWSMWDYFYYYKPSTDVYNWVPPFKGRAAIAGSQHFMTFDKNFYEFAGECSYLLARDFIDGEFYVSVNYDNVLGDMTKKSITVGSKGHEAEIFADARVIVDGTRREMPVEFDNSAIKRVGNTIRLDNSMGLTVICDLVHDRCTVNVTGWYFGKTAGLFGTYNNEQVDDMTMPDNTISSTTEEFTSSWTLGRRCRAVNNAVKVTPNPDNRRYKLCAALFEEKESQFRPCYPVVDPEPFMKMCINDMPVNENRIETEEDTCSMAAFYVDECKREGVNIRVPSTCVRCEMANDGAEFIEGDDVEITEENVPQSADTIFIVQHSECNEQLLDKVMDIAVALDKSLKANEVLQNKYAIVGFGGQGALATPHVHTMDGQIFNSRDKIQAGLENFNAVAGDNKDILRALRFASNLPFRGGVSKNLILLPCDKCQEGLVTYPEIQQVLLQKDIRLHVLMQETFSLKGKEKKAGVIFGADKDGVFTKKSMSDAELQGDATLARYVQLPKDICVPLTEETDGSVWSSKTYLESRPAMQKKQLDVMVRVIAKKAQPTDCQVCECVPDETGVGKSECRSCEVRNPIYDLLPMFEDDEFLPETGVDMEQVISVEKKAELKEAKRRAKKLKKNKKVKALKLRKNRRTESS